MSVEILQGCLTSAQARIVELEAKNKELLDELQSEYNDGQRKIERQCELVDQIKRLERENEELKRDKARLDWLQRWNTELRAGIDAAMSTEDATNPAPDPADANAVLAGGAGAGDVLRDEINEWQ